MTQPHEKLEALEEELAARGADVLRLTLVRRARNFKRSWVEMAEGLSIVRKRVLFEQWGYRDLYDYCKTELLLTKSTVDKLTGTFAVIEAHAPQVLQRDGVAQPIPTLGAVDYFAKALRSSNDDEPIFESASDDDFDDLRQAVFEDNQSVAVLRKNFDSVFFQKADGVEAVETLQKTRSTLRRLEGLLARAEGLNEAKVEAAMVAIAALRDDLDVALPEAEAKVKKAS